MTDDFDAGYDQGRASRQAEIDQLQAVLKPFVDALTLAEKTEPVNPEARLLDCFHRLTLYEFGEARRLYEQREGTK